MKKLLIIQLDEAYFLYETLQVIERNQDAFRGYSVTLLANTQALSQIQDGSAPLGTTTITTDTNQVLKENFDLSANLSMLEASWVLHSEVKSVTKVGPFFKDDQLIVQDLWSTYLLTLKARAPFLTFHLQDIYRNILGIKKQFSPEPSKRSFRKIAYGFCHPDFFPAEEQEKLINHLIETNPGLHIQEVSEVDPISDLSEVLYIGPATLTSLKLCESGAQGVFLARQFQGFNLLPYDEGHWLITSSQNNLDANSLLKFIGQYLRGNIQSLNDFGFSIYRIDHESLYGSHLTSLNKSDVSYPFYQSYVVLWNFILSLYDTNLDIIQCTNDQIDALKTQSEVLAKLVRLYDYAMSSIDSVHREAKAEKANQQTINEQVSTLKEIESITDKISQTNVYLRPILDFYRIRRGQNSGISLFEQSQHSFLTYSEEHQALKAIQELFSVTLQKNTANI